MALGEQFLSRRVTETAQGITGHRVFLVDWEDRYKHGGGFANPIPRHNDRWNPADDARILPADTQDLWVHDIQRIPYGSSSAPGSKKAATQCRVEVSYHGWPLDLTKKENWIVEARQHVATVAVGRELVFEHNRAHRVPQREVQLVPRIEYVIIGEQQISPDDKEVVTLMPAGHQIGTVCAETFAVQGFGYKQLAHLSKAEAFGGHLLFAGQSVSRIFYRRDAQGIRNQFRRFERSVIWHGVADTDNKIIGGWNLIFDNHRLGKQWDWTYPPLYRVSVWKHDVDENVVMPWGLGQEAGVP